MVIPTPDEVAKLMGLSSSPGPPDLKKPTPQEVERLREMYIQIREQLNDSFFCFSSQISASHLLALVQTLLVMLRSLEGPSGVWWELHVGLLDALTAANLTFASGYLQRLVRENETEALRIYVLVLDSLGILGYLGQVRLKEKRAVLRSLIELWQRLLESFPQQLPSLPNLPQISGQTLDGLTKLRLALPVGSDEPSLSANGRKTLKTLTTALMDAPDGYYEACREAAREFPGQWWRCEVTRDVERWADSGGSKCSQLSEGAEMMACSRCLTVRYCSKQHQKKDWKEHKKVCCKTEW